jgi:acyl-coenzyme A thioesterase PaaI-like protein
MAMTTEWAGHVSRAGSKVRRVMLQELVSSEPEIRLGARPQSSCFACGPDNSRGLRLHFQGNEAGEMVAEWIPESELEGFQGIVHGGIVSTVLDEAMSKVVAESGVKALTAELRVRFRQHVPSGKMIRVRGWIDSQNKRMTKTEAVLTSSDGTELAHAWATFLALKYAGNIQSY